MLNQELHYLCLLYTSHVWGMYSSLQFHEDTPVVRESRFVARQMDCVFQDIFPDAIKIGMVSRPDIILAIAKKLTEYQAHPVVLDPVMAVSYTHLLPPVSCP